MSYKNIGIILACILLATGCVNTNNLDHKFAYYFHLLNTSKDHNEIRIARQDLEHLYFALEAEESIHKADFKYLLNSYRAAEIAETLENPQLIQKLIRAGLHPSNNVEFIEKYQKAQRPENFSSINSDHISALVAAYSGSKKMTFSRREQVYNFGDLINAWKDLKKFPDETKAVINLMKNLEGGLCFGVTTLANKLICKDPSLSPEKTIEKINKNFALVIAWQIQQNIAVKLKRKTASEAAGVFIKNYSSEPIKEYFEGFRLGSEVKLFMAKLLKKRVKKGRDFVARVSFSVGNSGHAVAIQMLEGGKEYRLIDNNIGVLSFSTLEDFLEAFACYRLAYYNGAAMPIMSVLGNYCQ